MHALKILLVVNTQTYANGSASQYVYMGILNLFVAILLMSNFIDLETPSSKKISAEQLYLPLNMTWSNLKNYIIANI